MLTTVSEIKVQRWKNINIHDASPVHILKKEIEKMKSKNLPEVRYRKNCRLAREQVALRDSIYYSMINIKDNIL